MVMRLSMSQKLYNGEVNHLTRFSSMSTGTSTVRSIHANPLQIRQSTCKVHHATGQLDSDTLHLTMSQPLR